MIKRFYKFRTYDHYSYWWKNKELADIKQDIADLEVEKLDNLADTKPNWKGMMAHP